MDLSQASTVYLHSVDEVSSYDIRPQFQADVGMSMELLITMKQTYTTTDTEQLSVAQRKCIFQGEYELKYYDENIYSLSACMKQCRMQTALKLCKCVPPFYQTATGKYQQCMLSDIKCLNDNQKEITNIRGCKDCELSCLSTVYESEKLIKK